MTEPQQLDNLSLIENEIRRRLKAPQKIDEHGLAVLVDVEGRIREIRREDAEHKSGSNPERGRREMQSAFTKALTDLMPVFKADIENRATELQAKLRVASAFTNLLDRVTGSLGSEPPKVADLEG